MGYVYTYLLYVSSVFRICGCVICNLTFVERREIKVYTMHKGKGMSSIHKLAIMFSRILSSCQLVSLQLRMVERATFYKTKRLDLYSGREN